MLSILATYANQSGDLFPDTLAVNSSGALSTDGTEFIAEMINDYMFGLMQAVLAYTGQTPNGTLEGPANSQFLEGMRRAFGSPGDIKFAAYNDDPATLGIRAIKLTGQGIVRANYPLLDTMVYCGNANNATYTAFFRADNANGTSRNIAGAYLILPDMRGRVIRALDTAAGVDPDGAARYLGSLQNHGMLSHFHNLYYYSGKADVLFEGNHVLANITSGDQYFSKHTSSVNQNYTSIANQSGGITETRMVNAAFDCYIVY